MKGKVEALMQNKEPKKDRLGKRSKTKQKQEVILTKMFSSPREMLIVKFQSWRVKDDPEA